MLESGWMLVAAWLIFGQIAGYRYARHMVFRLFTKYQVHFEVIVNQQRYWFNDTYWIVNSILYYGLFTFLAIFMYGVISAIFGLNPSGGWYVAYITLFASIWYRSRDKSKNVVYQKSCDRIDVLLDTRGYSINFSDLPKAQEPDRDSMTRKDWANRAAASKTGPNNPSQFKEKA